MPIVSTLLLVCSFLGDTVAVVQSPVSDTVNRDTTDSGLVDTATSLPQPLPDTMSGESEGESDSIDSTGINASVSPDRGTPITVKTPPPYVSNLYLTTEGVNFESTESDVIDIIEEDEDDQEEVEKLFSVMLDRDSRWSGLGILIPGSVATTVGEILLGLGVVISEIDSTVSSAQMNDFSVMMIAGSFMAIGGAIMVTVGIPQFKMYLRWSDRYRLP
jgi:hypothetical protein